ncbi:unnamed protein product, partial [Ascophyllum nodosum]
MNRRIETTTAAGAAATAAVRCIVFLALSSCLEKPTGFERRKTKTIAPADNAVQASLGGSYLGKGFIAFVIRPRVTYMLLPSHPAGASIRAHTVLGGRDTFGSTRKRVTCCSEHSGQHRPFLIGGKQLW